MRFCDVKSGDIVSEELEHNASIKAIAVSDKSKKVISADNQGTIVIRNLATKKKRILLMMLILLSTVVVSIL